MNNKQSAGITSSNQAKQVLNHEWIVALEDTDQIIDSFDNRDDAIALMIRLHDEGATTVSVTDSKSKLR